ncbi:MAG TPA: hypothetical protein VEC99_16355 [Clostridia bacterium]|nr:hypothetical protein [Clostridia bacterium]
MSVNLNSKDDSWSENISNGSWQAVVACARAYDNRIPAWNGCHDGQEWSPEHLTIMADRLERTAEMVPMLRELAQRGGVSIS